MLSSPTLSSPKRKLTSEILENSSQVYGRSHTNAILGQTPFDVAQHASHGEDDPGLGGPGRLCRLLLSPSAGHRAEIALLSGSAAKQPGSIKKVDFKVSKPSNKLQTQVKITDLEKRTAESQFPFILFSFISDRNSDSKKKDKEGFCGLDMATTYTNTKT